MNLNACIYCIIYCIYIYTCIIIAIWLLLELIWMIYLIVFTFFFISFSFSFTFSIAALSLVVAQSTMYLIHAYYADNMCTNLYRGDVFQLNVCIYQKVSKQYAILTASQGTGVINVSIKTFFDVNCLSPTTNVGKSAMSTSCNGINAPVASLSPIQPTVPSNAGDGLLFR